MYDFQKINLVLGILNDFDNSIKKHSVRIGDIYFKLIEKNIELKFQSDLGWELHKIMDKLKEDDCIEVNPVRLTAEYGVVKNTIYYSITEKGKKYLDKNVYKISVEIAQKSQSNFFLINLALPLFSEYGFFDVGYELHKVSSDSHNRGASNIHYLVEFLVNNGFIKGSADSYKLTDRGRMLKKCGSYELFFAIEEEKERKENQKIFIQEELLQYEARNYKWQVNKGNNIMLLNVVIACLGIVTSGLIAYYVSKEEKPIINKVNVVIDSTFIDKIRYRDSTKIYNSDKAKSH